MNQAMLADQRGNRLEIIKLLLFDVFPHGHGNIHTLEGSDRGGRHFPGGFVAKPRHPEPAEDFILDLDVGTRDVKGRREGANAFRVFPGWEGIHFVRADEEIEFGVFALGREIRDGIDPVIDLFFRFHLEQRDRK